MGMKLYQAEELLNGLASRAGCECLSDLHVPAWRETVCHAVKQVRAEEYTIDAWNEAVRYIGRQEKSFMDQREAQQYLYDILKGNR